MNKTYDFSIYIGRFQPFHLAHKLVIEHALSISNKLIIVIGSHNKPIDWKNPWTSSERIEMIKASLSDEQLKNIYFQTVEDVLYSNLQWEASMYDAVNSVLMQYSKFRLNAVNPENKPKIALVGCDKDKSTWYLRSFPTWKQELTDEFFLEGNTTSLNSTYIRSLIYSGKFGYAKELLPEATFSFIKEWLTSNEADYVKEWFEFDKKYQAPYINLPYGTNFYCADSVVFHSGNVLLIKRKHFPGKNLWACPGGHITVNEGFFEASIRELKEETNINIPTKILIANHIGEKVFDHPDRSLRGRVDEKKIGRTISVSNCFVLQNLNGDKLPKVKASDDALLAYWFNIAEVKKMRNQMFEDSLDQILFWANKIEDKNYK